jgi:hypothetical protein
MNSLYDIVTDSDSNESDDQMKKEGNRYDYFDYPSQFPFHTLILPKPYNKTQFIG